MVTRTLLAGLMVATLCAAARADVKTKTIQYSDGETKLEGYMAWDDSIEGKRPGVLVVHEWWGLNDYARMRADKLARLGYVAFALDMYGKDKVTEHPKQAGEWAAQIRENVDAWMSRSAKGLEILKSHELTDGDRLAAIGYCFGGATVCEMAYHGLGVKGVVSFHGSLPVPKAEQAKGIKAKLLICHGAADGFVPEEKAQKFRAALEEANVDYQMVYYGGARHSFTNPNANEYGIDNVKYDPAADRRSWQDMQTFFAEIFAEE